MKVGLIGDLHFREHLAYADLISDRRVQEKRNVLNTIEDAFSDHDLIVFMGDNLNLRNNLSSVVDEFVQFLSRFDGKEVIVLAGNHEKFGDGRSALDFLKRVKGKRWTVVTNKEDVKLLDIGGLRILPLPFLTNPELGVKSYQDGHSVLNGIVEKFEGDLFVGHHALDMDLMKKYEEPRLYPDMLWNHFAVSAIGHIHEPKATGGVRNPKEDGKRHFDFIRTGSTFTSSIGELFRYAWSINFSNGSLPYVEDIPLPVRPIFAMRNPDEKIIKAAEAVKGHYAIVKAEVTDRSVDVDALRRMLKSRFDGTIVLEHYDAKRKKVSEDVNDFSIERMLEMYAKSKKMSKELFIRGYELVRD